MILELVSGGDLLSLVKKRGRLGGLLSFLDVFRVLTLLKEERHARDITYQICDALAVGVSLLEVVMGRTDHIM